MVRRPVTFRTRNVTGYPLYSEPRPWPVAPGDMEHIFGLSRAKDNILPFPWGGQVSNFAPIFVERENHWVALKLARLSTDFLETLDVQKAQEELLSPGDGKYFTESAHLLIDSSTGLCIGEFKPAALSVLSERTPKLINNAFAKAKRSERISLHPFPSRSFREVVLGKGISKYTLKLGPASTPVLEEEGFSAPAIRRMVENDAVVGVDVTITVQAHEETDEKKAHWMEKLAGIMGQNRAKTFRILTADGEPFDLLRNNFTMLDCSYDYDPKGVPAKERAALFAKMRAMLNQTKAELLTRIPSTRTRKLFEFEKG